MIWRWSFVFALLCRYVHTHTRAPAHIHTTTHARTLHIIHYTRTGINATTQRFDFFLRKHLAQAATHNSQYIRICVPGHGPSGGHCSNGEYRLLRVFTATAFIPRDRGITLCPFYAISSPLFVWQFTYLYIFI